MLQPNFDPSRQKFASTDAATFAVQSSRMPERQLAELDYVTSSRAASQTLAENYVGLPTE